MNFTKSKSSSLLGLLFTAAVIGLFAATALPSRAQVTSTRLVTGISNSVVVVFTNGTHTFAGTTNMQVDVPQTGTLGLYLRAAAAGDSVSNLTTTVEFTPDNTNWITSPTCSFIFTLNNKTGVNFYTNFPTTSTYNMRKVRLKTIVGTPDTNVFFTNIFFIKP